MFFGGARTSRNTRDEILDEKAKGGLVSARIRNDEVAEKFAEAGIKVVQDLCLMVEHRAFAMNVTVYFAAWFSLRVCRERLRAPPRSASGFAPPGLDTFIDRRRSRYAELNDRVADGVEHLSDLLIVALEKRYFVPAVLIRRF